MLLDGDWITILAALMNDSHSESQKLASRLLARSKPGRQVRLLRMIRQRKPTLSDMALRLRVSRRTVFRYLRDLDKHGVLLHLDDGRHYHLDQTPRNVQRLL